MSSAKILYFFKRVNLTRVRFDYFKGFFFRSQQKLGAITYDPLVESETITIKVEPIDFDDESNNSNPFESPPNDSDITPNESDINPNESDSTPNKSTNKFLSRDELTYPIQCAIVSKMFKGRALDDICKLYNITPDVVNEIWEDRERYEVQKPGHRSHKHFNARIEKKILEWMQQQKDNNIQVSGKMIQNAAEGYAKELGFVAFDGSRKWLDRFKKKHDIMFRTRRRDYTATPDNKCKTQFFVEQWAEAREGLSDDDIYIADEVGLFYNPSKNRIQKLRGKKFVQGCIKDRLSIFLCTNASGRDKKKLLVCGTEDPLMHSHRDPQTLPVLYVRHAQAHFTTRIFEEYVTCWNKELLQCNKKALLILDRATIHSKLQLSNLKLLFVPYKSKNSLIPIRNGVYSRFRDEFRRLILEDKVMNCMNGVDRNITCLEALSILEKSWERTPPEVITMSFFSIGYDVTMPDSERVLTPRVSENDEEMLCDILKNYDIEHYYTDLSLLDEYLTVDDDLLTGQGTNASVFGGNHKAIPKNEVEEHLPIGTEKPESDEVEATIKKARAMQDLEIVKKYLQSKDTPFGTYCALMEVEKFVTRLPRCSDT